jgi:hemerythrin
MNTLVWSEKFELGIEVIDEQHRTIMDYVIQFLDAHSSGRSRKEISKLIKKVIDYTHFHFAFEEDLQEKVGYPFVKPHKKSHTHITKHMADFLVRFDNGDDISKEVEGLMAKWLFDHLKHDDADFVGSVNEYLHENPDFLTKKTSIFTRLFKL